MIQSLRIQEEFADAVCSGRKTFEIRQEDNRTFEAGDRVGFRVVDADGKDIPSHALNRKWYRVTYVLRGWGIEEGYAAIAIKPVDYATLDFASNRSVEWVNTPALQMGV